MILSHPDGRCIIYMFRILRLNIPWPLPYTYLPMSVMDELKWRGLIADCTDMEGVTKLLSEKKITLYCGFDPTADSLHVGNLIPLLTLRRFQLLGHHVLALAGGATGSIGDPSGRTAERQLLTHEILSYNVECVKKQLSRFLDFNEGPNPALLVDNATWMAPFTFLDFLRDVGKHFSVNTMIAKESVRARLQSDTGITYTEFSYMLLQAYDFCHLNKEYGCELQIGGSDQWGNITAGMDLSKKMSGVTLYGLTLPLLLNADGTKFGKSLGGAVYLDPNKTSVYRFYQFWIRVDDRDVIKLLKFYTFLSKEQIEELSAQHEAKPEARLAHKALAYEMTRLIHGEEATQDAIRASEILFGGTVEGISERNFEDVASEVPNREISISELSGEGKSILELLVLCGLCTSKGQARKDVEAGGIYLANNRENNIQRMVSAKDLMFGKYLLLRKGKRNYSVLKANL